MAISVVVLLVLFVGGGAAYTYYMGSSDAQANANIDTSSSPVSAATPITPSKPSPKAKESVAVETFTTPLKPGSTASIAVKTLATSKCTISVMYNNMAAKDAALKQQIADDFGNVSWDWTVGSSVPLGKWPVKVTCVYNGRSAVVQADLEVVRKI